MNKVKTKDLIRREAINQFYKKGFRRTSIRDIVKAVGITNASVYNHFKNKDHLLYEIISTDGENYIRIYAEIAERGGHPLDKLKEMIASSVHLIKESRKEFKIFIEDEHQLSPPLRKKTLEQQRVIYSFFKDQIVALEKLGSLRPVNESVATFSCFAIISWFYRWYQEHGNLTVEEIADDLVQIALGGILNAWPGKGVKPTKEV